MKGGLILRYWVRGNQVAYFEDSHYVKSAGPSLREGGYEV